MQFTTTHDYPAGLSRLWATFGRPSYPREKYRALGATAVRLQRFDAAAQTIEVELERVMPIDEARVPAWARPFVGREQTLQHRSRWRRIDPARIEAELEVVPVGLPVRAHGTGTIVERAPGSSRMSLAWRVDSGVPGLGDRVERLFAAQVRDALEQDHRFTVGALREPRGGAGGDVLPGPAAPGAERRRRRPR